MLDHVGTTGTLSGTSHVDIGVAKNPTSSYTFYRIDTTNDSPLCTLDGVNPGPCFPDFPHIGADRNGFYVTTNVFDFFGPNFDGVNIYALPKFKLTSGASSVPVTIVSTNGQGPSGPDGGTGFSVIPAVTPDDQFDGAGGGTEHFVSSRAVFTNDGTASSIVSWSLSNTRSLLSSSPDLDLTSSLVDTDEYGVPAPPTQKPGDVPLATCIGSTAPTPPPSGPPCWSRLGIGFGGPVTKTENVLDGSDSRILSVSYANGKLWAVLGSAATDSNGNPADGVAWFVMNPHGPSTGLINQGMLVKDGSNLTYPSIAATSSGDAAMGFTIVGPNDYPSAGYAGLDAKSGAGDPQYAAKGAGPQDGFTEYAAVLLRRKPAPSLGRLHRRRRGRSVDLGRVRVHRPDLHVQPVRPAVADERRGVRHVRRHPRRARQLGHAHLPAAARRVVPLGNAKVKGATRAGGGGRLSSSLAAWPSSWPRSSQAYSGR